MKKFTFLMAIAMLLAFQLAAQTTIFPYGSSWKYLDTGTDQGTAWRATAFSDGTWKTGNGTFGYGYGNEATTISYGPDPNNKYITTYFRKAVTITNVAAFTSFTGNVKRDDGVVVFVNGNEVFRNNIPGTTIIYTTRASSASDNGQTGIPFTIPVSAFVSGTNVIAVEVHQTNNYSFDMAFDLQLTGTPNTTGDTTPPSVLSLNRHLPLEESTSNTSVIFRATFSEAVTGVDVTDFLKVGTASGTVASVAAVSSSIYDVTVNNISGSGSLGLDLKASATGIADAAANPISGGFTGQAYTITTPPPPPPPTGGFVSVTTLNPITARVSATKGRPQAKVFSNAGRHWAIIAATGGTYLWRLDGINWTQILRLSSKNARADCIVEGNTTHIFLYLGQNSELFSVEYDPINVTYVPWSKRKVKVDLVLDTGIETGTIALDGTGRMWLATDAITDINVRYSDAPYTSWSGPITIAAGVDDDDISAIVAMPNTGKIGVLWSNQVTKRFGFRTHADGTLPTSWTADEVPAAGSALNEGKGMADDHMDIKITADGTLFCAVKTGYDEPGFPEIALLVRRPTGTWEPLHKVSESGTAGIVLVNEAQSKVKVVYTSDTYAGNIVYKETATSSISFGPELTLISGLNNYATSTHYTYNSDIVVLASNEAETVGVLASDVAGSGTALVEASATLAVATTTTEVQEELLAYPNPFISQTTIRFALKTDGPYTLTLYDNTMGQVVYQKQGSARAGEENIIEVEAAKLRGGLYFAKLQTNESSKTLRLLLKK